jgi:hypothetical protein
LQRLSVSRTSLQLVDPDFFKSSKVAGSIPARPIENPANRADFGGHERDGAMHPALT